LKRGELYRVYKPGKPDPKRFRVFVVVSRQVLIDSRFPTVICAPIFTEHHGLSTQVAVGPEQGLKHDSSIHCDELVSLQKTVLTSYVGILNETKLRQLDKALTAALALDL
jgi:mRNA interferase MazF